MGGRGHADQSKTNDSFVSFTGIVFNISASFCWKLSVVCWGWFIPTCPTPTCTSLFRKELAFHPLSSSWPESMRVTYLTTLECRLGLQAANTRCACSAQSDRAGQRGCSRRSATCHQDI